MVPARGNADGRAQPPNLLTQPGTGRGERGLRILVIEDNQDAAHSLRLLLELYGHQVAVAYTGLDGVRAAHGNLRT